MFIASKKITAICLSIFVILIGFISIVQLTVSSTASNHPTNPSSLDSALSSFQLPQGFKIEVLAAEPLIGDPVDMEIDEDGRLYVVEMPGYPLDKSGTGSVRLLSDTNGDGRMDTSVLFADNLVLPNSVMRWKQGILVTDAPYVLYFEDSDGDGKSDVRDTVLTGFALSNPQHNLNSPVLGIDNWIYLAHEGAVSTETYEKEFGDRGTNVYFPKSPSSPTLGVNANGRAVRFKMDTLLLEETSGRTQFGHTFDQWGRHFLVGNANHIYQEVIAANYLKRNKHMAIAEATESISDHGSAAEVFPIAENPQHQLLTDIGVITSACGLTSYLGGAFPAPYDERVTFVAEPVSNLVHVDKLQDKGSTFVASRVLERAEFLASRDPKFRPVNMYIGPDGALYVVDYYRQIIEHPEWMADEVVRSGALYNDANRGRIYRISSDNMTNPAWTKGVNLGSASSIDLVAKLSDKNIWWRMNAQRLLIDRGDPGVATALRTAATESSSAVGRVHALWTMEAFNALSAETIAAALKDSEAGVRENAIRLAELHMGKEPALVPKLLSLASDPDAHVRFQLMCTIGSIDTDDADEVRKEILFQDLKDPWIQLAALAASSGTADLLDATITRAASRPGDYRALIERLSALLISSGDVKALTSLMPAATQIQEDSDTKRAKIQAAILNGLAMGAERSSSVGSFTSSTQDALARLVFEHAYTDVKRAALRLLRAGPAIQEPVFRKYVERAKARARDRRQAEDDRALAIVFLALREPAQHQDLLLHLLAPQEPLPIQLAAIKSLNAITGTSISRTLIERWPSLTPELHDATIGALLNTDDRIDLMLDALEANQIPSSAVSWPRRVRLMAQSNLTLRNRARKLFSADNVPAVRNGVEAILKLKGSAGKGKEVFQQNCALCHQVRGSNGVELGPDLGTVHNWSPEAILSNIVSPNQSISSGYDLWTVELTNGTTEQGIISGESPGAITLRNIGSLEKTINRNEIKSLRTLNMSVMPDDLAQKISKQQMADLLAFLKQNQ